MSASMFRGGSKSPFQALVLAIFVVVPSGLLFADLSVETKLEREEYLMFEKIELQIRVRNQSAQSVILPEKEGDRPWIRIHVMTKSDEMIDSTKTPWKPEPIIMKGGETTLMTVDLTPSFYIREPGEYQVVADVDDRGSIRYSRPVSFSVARGVPLWKKKYTAAADPHDLKKSPRPREYALIVHRVRETQVLYVRIMDPDTRIIYCTSSLGSVVNYDDPMVRIDINGNLHVLHQSGTRVFTYTEFDPNGVIQFTRYFSNISSEPQLVASGDGDTTVIGGEEYFPTENGLQMIPTPPKVKKNPDEEKKIKDEMLEELSKVKEEKK